MRIQHRRFHADVLHFPYDFQAKEKKSPVGVLSPVLSLERTHNDTHIHIWRQTLNGSFTSSHHDELLLTRNWFAK